MYLFGFDFVCLRVVFGVCVSECCFVFGLCVRVVCVLRLCLFVCDCVFCFKLRCVFGCVVMCLCLLLVVMLVFVFCYIVCILYCCVVVCACEVLLFWFVCV